MPPILLAQKFSSGGDEEVGVGAGPGVVLGVGGVMGGLVGRGGRSGITTAVHQQDYQGVQCV